MKKLLLAVLLVLSFGLVVVLAVRSPVAAAPSCTAWMKQPDGSEWRTCVDDKGKQYCQSNKNGHISKVDCNK